MNLKQKLVAAAAAGGAVAANAAGGTDFSSLTGAVDFTTVGTAILAIGALMMAPKVIGWGTKKVLGMVRG